MSLETVFLRCIELFCGLDWRLLADSHD